MEQRSSHMEEVDKGRGHLLRWLFLKFCLVSLANSNENENGVVEQTGTDVQQALDEKYDDLPPTLPSITTIKRAIPKHCFQPKVSMSMFYVALDITAVAFLYVMFEWLWSYLPLCSLCMVTPFYWLIQGTFFTALFVLGHDCGHDSFSKYPWLNDIVGTVLHTFLLIPYYCWKLSHRNHHKNTGNIDKDEVFYPIREKHMKGKVISFPAFGLGIGWYAYMAMGYGHRPIHHYNVFHKAFSNHFIQCFISVSCVVGWTAILYHYALHAGLTSLILHYVIPLFVFGSWGVIFTFLHHTDENVPWFSDEKWEFVRGQLSSIDRDYGWADGLTHSIGTHQIHHLFTKVPHYHLREATDAFRKQFPELVRYSREPIIPLFIKMFYKFVKQNVIGDDVTVHVYR